MSIYSVVTMYKWLKYKRENKHKHGLYLQWCLFFTGFTFLVETGHKSCCCDVTLVFHPVDMGVSLSLSLSPQDHLLLSISAALCNLSLSRSRSLARSPSQFNSVQFKGLYWHGKHILTAKASEVDNIHKLNKQ